MMEYRLIENIIALIKRELKQIETTNQVDPLIIDKGVYFIRVYADRTHCGKEGDILLKKLENKNISDQDKQLMENISPNRKII